MVKKYEIPPLSLNCGANSRRSDPGTYNEDPLLLYEFNHKSVNVHLNTVINTVSIRICFYSKSPIKF